VVFLDYRDKRGNDEVGAALPLLVALRHFHISDLRTFLCPYRVITRLGRVIHDFACRPA